MATRVTGASRDGDVPFYDTSMYAAISLASALFVLTSVDRDAQATLRDGAERSGKRLAWRDDEPPTPVGTMHRACLLAYLHIGIPTCTGKAIATQTSRAPSPSTSTSTPALVPVSPSRSQSPSASPPLPPAPDVASFRLPSIDVEQWIAALRAGGVEGVVVTAKGDGGFCLWSTETTPFSVDASPTPTDVVRALAERCHAEGFRFGISFSLADLREDEAHPDAAVDRADADAGDADPDAIRRGRPGHVDGPNRNEATGAGLGGGTGTPPEVVRRQLRELCERYGPLHWIRLEAASDATRALIDWASLRAMIQSLQPTAHVEFVHRGQIQDQSHESDSVCPPRSEAISLRPGWYWRQSENEHVTSLMQLEQSWYSIVGRGQTLLLGVPPDARGRIADPDVQRLRELGDLLRATFAHKLCGKESVRVLVDRQEMSPRDAAALVDDDRTTVWVAPAPRDELTTEIQFATVQPVNRVEIVEPTEAACAIRGFEVAVDRGPSWQVVASGAEIGGRQVLRFETHMARSLRLTLRAVQPGAALASLQAYAAPPVVQILTHGASPDQPTRVEMRSDAPDVEIYYTLDGRTPTRSSARYDAPLTIEHSVEHSVRVRAAAFRGEARSLYVASQDIVRYDESLLQSPIAFIRPPDPGIRMRRIDGRYRSLHDVPAAPITDERIVETIALPRERPADRFALLFDGFIEAPSDGMYTFTLRSDDGSRLFVANQLVIDRDSSPHWEWWQGRLGLKAGWHPIRLQYFELGGEERLQLRWSGPGFGEEDIPPSRFAH